MKNNLARFHVSFICQHCNDIHHQLLAARDTSEAFKKSLDAGAVSFNIIADPANEAQPTSPTLFYEEAGKIHARVFLPNTPREELQAFVASCAQTKSFRGIITAHQAIYTRHGD